MIQRTACLVSRSLDAWRNQAVEKHLMDTLPEDTAVLFLWQNQRSVWLGRGEDAGEACHLEELTRQKGQLARRLSGGGALYLDPGCLGYSLIVPKSAFDIPRQMSVLGMGLGAFGLQTCTGGACDVGVAGQCVGRNAFFKSGSAAWQHGALLVESDLETLNALVAPDGQQRFASVQNLRSLADGVTVDSLERSLCQAFAHAYGSQPAWLDERMLDGRTIDALAQRFAAERWLTPAQPAASFTVSERFPWGGATVRFATESGVIRHAQLYTDAMEAALFERIGPALVGAPFLISAITARFDQALEWLSDPRLMQMAQDVCNLICRRIRTSDRQGL